ncbi:MAG TPA: FtsK/SpoIIIE domain-containing protein, partial [Mycobacterium sp.]|nr:FtsK/SpoIIIE domain-containing protein [Mycobacterium sp.]
GSTSAAGAVPWVVELGWGDLGRPLPAKPAVEAEAEEDTDLRVLVGEICKAASEIGVPRQRSPWLDPLPGALLLDTLLVDDIDGIDGIDVEPHGAAEGDRLPRIPYGIEDFPGEQAQRPVLLDFETFNHLLAGGAPRTGRSQLLRTIAGSIARRVSSADVHLYGIDCGNGALLPLTALPHCGAVVQRAQPERAARLIQRLANEVLRRQEILAQQGFSSIGEQRAATPTDERLAHLVVLVDRWEGFTTTLGELDNGRLTDELMKMFREGASVGVHLIVTGDRTLLSGRIAAMTEERIAFRLADKADYSYIGMNSRQAPDAQPPGRAIRADSLRELQVALLTDDETGQAQAAALAEIGADAARRDAEIPRGRRPFRVDVLPALVRFDHAWALRERVPAPALFALLGVGGDELTALGVDLGVGVPTLVIAGPPRSGRSTAAAAVARSLLACGSRLLVATPRVSLVTQAVSGEPGVVVTPDGRLDEHDVAVLLDDPRPLTIVVDDAELLRECGAATLLRQIVAGGVGPGRAIVLAGNADGMCSGLSGWQVDVKKGRRGLLLSPQGNGDGDLIGVRLPRSAIGGAIVPGRGLAHLGDNELVSVQVPLV